MSEVDSHIPEFTLEENENEVKIVIVAPLAKPKEAAFVLEKDVFSFESPPYLLKLKLPCPVADRFSQQSYDNATRTYKIKLKKTDEVWQDDSDEEEDVLNPSTCTKDEENTLKDPENEKKTFYGFGNMYSNMFGRLYCEFSEVINLPDPDRTEVHERKVLREKEEDEKWNDDHYLADTMETKHLQSIFDYQPSWTTSPLKDKFRNDECEILDDLMNEQKINKLSKENIRLSEFQIVDILFSYAYNVRTTEGDNTVESDWTISKLSATLSWFEVFSDLKSVVLACYRRSLIYPLYRNWNLTQMIHKDVVNILKTGPKQITRCLLEVRDVFNDNGYYYVLNSLYVNDLCNFAVHMMNDRCIALSEELEKINIKKSEVNADLPLLEIAAHLALEDDSSESETDVEKLVDKIAKLHFGKNTKSSTDTRESGSSDSSESTENED